MKKTLLLLLAFITIMVNVNAQKKDRIVQATDSLITDGVLTVNGNDFDIESASTDGQFLRKVSGKWINQDFTGTGTDSIRYRVSDGYLLDYRGGSVFDSTKVYFEDIVLENITLVSGENRYIKVADAVGGDAGDDLTIQAGSDPDGLDGGDVYIYGGGSIEYGDVYIGANESYSVVYVRDTLDMTGKRIKNMAAGVEPNDAVTMSQIEDLSKGTYSIGLPYATSVAGRVAGTIIYGEGTEDWVLAAAGNNIDLLVTHNLGRRISNVNVMTVNGTIEQLLRPFAGAYSGWQTNSVNQLQINGLATTPLPIKIYLSFE